MSDPQMKPAGEGTTLPSAFGRLTCYQISEPAPKIVPAAPERQWMDETNERFAYRCLPLNIANSFGWELLLPIPIVAEWNGGPELTDITVTSPESENVERYASSHFGHGVLTFQTHYLFRTDPGVALWARGSPNLPKDGIAPLDGITETDWLTFTFTMNWKFTRPGRVEFAKDEPFLFITPIAYRALDNLVPEIVPIKTAPEILAEFNEHRRLRNEFNKALQDRDPEALRRRWQKWYFRGTNPDGEPGNELHISKLRLARPRTNKE